MAGDMTEDPQGCAGQYSKKIPGTLLEIGGFALNFQKYYWNILGALGSSALGIHCHTSCYTWNFPMILALRLMDCLGAQEESEGRPGEPGDLKTAREVSP